MTHVRKNPHSAAENGVTITGGLDTMAHIGKGVVGLFLSGVVGFRLVDESHAERKRGETFQYQRKLTTRLLPTHIMS